ncbi:hypothetical protein HPB49_025686 [Dermacentor silvarum]|nr:hypothetical protein HPB49_025686 [Dermacentor silvarum]
MSWDPHLCLQQDTEILCWDLRNLGKVLYCMKRTVTTHQRMYFELSRCGNYLISGNSNGIVTAWDLKVEPLELEDCEPLKKPGLFFKAHDDCVNGIRYSTNLSIIMVFISNLVLMFNLFVMVVTRYLRYDIRNSIGQLLREAANEDNISLLPSSFY